MDKKRVKAFGNLLMGIRFITLMKMILRNGTGFRPLHILRIIVLIPTSILVEVFIIVEKLRSVRAVRKTIIEKPPVFIIGHWRSGTTLLHQLLALDTRFTTPTLVQTVAPEHFLFSSKYWIPIMEKTMPPKRPMDEVVVGPLDPMEDEWALLRMNVQTPLEKIFFPSRTADFLSCREEFLPEGKDRTRWGKCLLTFLGKITLCTGKRIILKNPFHTPRIRLLNDLLPGSKFIHIVRHPYKIVPSAINMWNILAAENAFKGGWKEPDVKRTAAMVEWFRKKVDDDKTILAPGQFVELRYEDLEKDPVKEISRVYNCLGISFSSEFEGAILRFMEEKKAYRKNVFILSAEDREAINKSLGDYMKCYGYEDQ
ncbi:MAG: sulfotransferase [Bacteroidales bacterium]|nr:sulfotransferase [Bacteroidales bacterium]MBN2634335.1 sulfotransferase [Bacteroidales bacterium]